MLDNTNSTQNAAAFSDPVEADTEEGISVSAKPTVTPHSLANMQCFPSSLTRTKFINALSFLGDKCIGSTIKDPICDSSSDNREQYIRELMQHQHLTIYSVGYIHKNRRRCTGFLSELRDSQEVRYLLWGATSCVGVNEYSFVLEGSPVGTNIRPGDYYRDTHLYDGALPTTYIIGGQKKPFASTKGVGSRESRSNATDIQTEPTLAEYSNLMIGEWGCYGGEAYAFDTNGEVTTRQGPSFSDIIRPTGMAKADLEAELRGIAIRKWHFSIKQNLLAMELYGSRSVSDL